MFCTCVPSTCFGPRALSQHVAVWCECLLTFGHHHLQQSVFQTGSTMLAKVASMRHANGKHVMNTQKAPCNFATNVCYNHRLSQRTCFKPMCSTTRCSQPTCVATNGFRNERVSQLVARNTCFATSVFRTHRASQPPCFATPFHSGSWAPGPWVLEPLGPWPLGPRAIWRLLGPMHFVLTMSFTPPAFTPPG